MFNALKSKWRKAHISKDDLKLGPYLRFNKKKFKIYSTRNAVPNLLILGSQKCGTSSLHYYLSAHPDIYMSSPFKEPGYFIFDQWGKDYWKIKGENIQSKSELKQKYMIDNSFVDQKYFGDSSTHYTIGNRVEKYDIVTILKKESPHAKIIYIIRNPFERITSSYYHMMKYWNYSKSIDEFIVDDGNSIKTTLYFNQIKPFADAFKPDVLILQFEDLIDDTQKVLNKTYDFLGLQFFNHHNEFKIYNKTTPADKSKFSVASYKKLIDLFTEQKKCIEENFNLKLNWDLSPETWISKDNSSNEL